jgi:Fe2+ or Zn2+ uptake regulation protein
MEAHDEVAALLSAVDQRYTQNRRAIVEVLAGAGRPLTVPEIVETASRGSLPVSSAYRNITVLLDAGIVHRVAGTDDHSRFELAEALIEHHHHLLCLNCGKVVDVSALPRLERALSEAADVAADETGFEVTGHRIDLVGLCADCQ